MELENVCRICANTIKDAARARNLFSYLRGKFLLQLSVLTGLELVKEDGLPERICERCSSELDLAIKFRERCIFSQKYLKDMLRSQREKDENYFNAVIKEDAFTDETDNVDADSLDSYELDLLQNDHIIEEDNYLKPEETSAQQQDNDSLMDDEGEEDVDAVKAEIREEVDMAIKKLALLDEQTQSSTERRPNFYICELCGHYVRRLSSYRTHLEQHAGRKPAYECDQCPRRFVYKVVLKRHRLSHTLGRRHKCAKCEARFADAGAKLRHEKAHANERPFPCLECNGTFKSAAELQAHLPKHIPMRRFRCEPCNRDFKVREDLVAHSSTERHKQNALQMQNEIDMLCEISDFEVM